MSTELRVTPAASGPSAFGNALAHQPALAGAFFDLYGTFWSHGRLDHVSKETARLRNARITDCGY